MLKNSLVIAVVHANVILDDIYRVDEGILDHCVHIEVNDCNVKEDSCLDVKDKAKLHRAVLLRVLAEHLHCEVEVVFIAEAKATAGVNR